MSRGNTKSDMCGLCRLPQSLTFKKLNLFLFRLKEQRLFSKSFFKVLCDLNFVISFKMSDDVNSD